MWRHNLTFSVILWAILIGLMFRIFRPNLVRKELKQKSYYKLIEIATLSVKSYWIPLVSTVLNNTQNHLGIISIEEAKKQTKRTVQISHLASEIGHVYFAALSHPCHPSPQLPNISVPAIKQYGQIVARGFQQWWWWRENKRNVVEELVVEGKR